MLTVGLKVLKNKLSEYVRRAAQGEIILISDRDQVVAELVPPQGGRAPRVADAVLADAIRSGLVSPAVSPPGRPPAAPPVASLAEILRGLDADRADR
ncbi:MAG TPA: prevent-host-death protein [Polyangia bacterium]|jgi:antitoxin (DNA-binding transcriptional repressor) of toxin-antitoxin stability system